jgi:hypothetical protein
MVLQQKGEWLKNRLESMGPAEVISRLADVGRHLTLCAYRKNIQGKPSNRFKESIGTDPLPDITNQLDLTPARARDAIIATADRCLEHRLSFFSLVDVRLGQTIDWHRDYSSGMTGPMTYSGLINARDMSAVGNVKYTWELNRLQHLIPLALAWRWTGNAGYWREIESQILSWDRSNPFMMGVNWKSPLEAGIRLITWAYVAFLTAGLRQSRELYDKALRRQVYQHQYFIRKFHSKHSSANNHLIGEMVGLYIGTVFWPWYEESRSWRTFSKQKLIQEIDSQVEPDGVGRERATEYQLFVLELFIAAGALGHATGDPFPYAYWNRINRMITFVSAISDKQGNIPSFGDGDNAQVISLPQTRAERFRALVELGRSSETTEARDVRSVLLLWGQAPKEIPLSRPGDTERTIQKFSDGGYYVLVSDRGCEDELVIVFDAGPIGLPPLNAHGHADALSFSLTYGGEEFLIDPGTYIYDGPAVWRSYFRGTAAHNTVRIDGEDQSIGCGTFLWREPAHCALEHSKETNEFVEVRGSHDGYSRYMDPVTHRRSLYLLKRFRALNITDTLECHGTHRVEIMFHLSERCEIRQTDTHVFSISKGARRIAIELDARLQPELYCGSERPIFGWVSHTFGVKHASFTLVARTEITSSTEFVNRVCVL